MSRASSFSHAVLVVGLLAGCTGEARIVPGPDSGHESGGSSSAGAQSGGGASGSGGTALGSGGLVAAGGTPAGAGGAPPGAGGGPPPGAGGALPPPPPGTGGAPGGGGAPCAGDPVTSHNPQCDGCMPSVCSAPLSACNGNAVCACAASCMLQCPTLTGRPQEQDACAVSCGFPGGRAGLPPGVVPLIDCLAPVGEQPLCLPCFHPPPP